MPKIIDPRQREVDVAEAAWRVLGRDSVTNLSVRKVAAEAGLAPGSLRRAFPTQNALLTFCLELVGRRSRERVTAIEPRASVRASVEACLFEFLPLDAERRIEMDVYFSIGSMAHVNPELTAAYSRVYSELREACVSLLGALEADLATPRPHVNIEIEAQYLHALLDGIALHLVQPIEHGGAERARSLVRTHLDRFIAF